MLYLCILDTPNMKTTMVTPNHLFYKYTAS
jgi:hypothetical protein